MALDKARGGPGLGFREAGCGASRCGRQSPGSLGQEMEAVITPIGRRGAAGEKLVHDISGRHGESPAAAGPGVLRRESREGSRVPEVVPNAGVLGGRRGASLFRWTLGWEVLAGPWYRPLLLSQGQVQKHPVRFLSASVPQAPPGTRAAVAALELSWPRIFHAIIIWGLISQGLFWKSWRHNDFFFNLLFQKKILKLCFVF